MSDFLHWDEDICLDEILGDYTDYDNLCPDSDEDFVQSVAPTTIKGTSIYVCPVCKKKLRTISGFRGHTTKQHNIHSLKASDHRQSTDANLHSVPSSQTPSFLQDDVFPSIFHRALQSSVSIIVDDPIYMNTDFRYLTERATSREVEQILRAVMHKLFLQVGVSVSSALERETLFQHFHRMRCDKSAMTEIQEAFASESTLTNRTVNNFLQILLMELIGQILSECYQQEVKQATDVKESMSQNDRQILYYIAGYIVRSLRKNTNRIHQTDEGVLAALDKMQSDGTTELSTYASWFNQVNRGGLKRPSDTLVDLVCAMEIVVRGKVSFDNLNSTSLLVAPLKEAILESTAVKHYADQIFRGCKFDNSFQVERIAYLFLTIRGFAVVRAKRTQLHASKTSNSKPSFSLRQVLGSKSINIM